MLIFFQKHIKFLSARLKLLEGLEDTNKKLNTILLDYRQILKLVNRRDFEKEKFV